MVVGLLAGDSVGCCGSGLKNQFMKSAKVNRTNLPSFGRLGCSVREASVNDAHHINASNNWTFIVVQYRLLLLLLVLYKLVQRSL